MCNRIGINCLKTREKERKKIYISHANHLKPLQLDKAHMIYFQLHFRIFFADYAYTRGLNAQ